MQITNSKIVKRRSGIAAVEFALIAPLFLLLLAAIIEFGQVFYIQHILSTATRRGVRCAVVKGSTTSQVVQKVKADCSSTLGVAEPFIDVVIVVNGAAGTELSAAKSGDEITVTVGIPFAQAGIGFYASLFDAAVLSTTCTFEHE